MEPLSVIIITLNEERRIGRLLYALSCQDYNNFEVIVVDSNSDDNTCRVAESYAEYLPKITVHKMQNRGVSLGRNTGVSLALHEKLLFLDADVELSPSFLHRAIQKMNKNNLEIAGVYLGAVGLSNLHKVGYTFFNLGFFITQFIFPTAVGACIFSSQRIHRELGGFDERIVLCEDCDYVRRAAKLWRFRFLTLTFNFDPRRLDRDGLLRTGYTYLRANIWRLFFGEMRNNEMKYKFGHYSS